MPAKTKARDIIPGWPRGRSTSSFTGKRYWYNDAGVQYRVWFLPWERQETESPLTPFMDWRQEWAVFPDFRRTTEQALESSYRAGQQAMVDDYRAKYRTLTDEDKAWLRYPGDDPLRKAMKHSFMVQYVESLATGCPLPLNVLFTIKEASGDCDTVILW